MRLLVVEDNEELAQLLAKGLESAGFGADLVTTAAQARKVLTTTRYAALVLDRGLPDGDGLAILREIRDRKDPIPVLMLTARAGVYDRVTGLRSGADDYLVKPFAFEELVARLEAMLRRPGQLLGRSLRLGNLVFDTGSRQAFIDDEPQVLSAREVAVLELLMRRSGRVVPKKLVEDHIFGSSGDVASNAVEVYVHRLRKQLAERGAKVQIHTIRGVGYLTSLDDRSPIFPDDARSPQTAFLATQHGNSQIYGVSIPKEIGNRTVWVQVAEDLAHRDVLIDDIVADFFWRVGWVTLPILLLLLAIDIAIFHRALRPVVRASEKAQSIGPTRTDVRLPVAGLPNEILPLVSAVNQALDRLEQGFRVQREFTADAAHELRTPLTILRTRIDTLADRQVAEALRQDIAGMSRIVSQLLDIAELETFVVDPLETADLQTICTEVAEFIAPLALAQGKNIALSGAKGPVWVKGNPETLSRAIRNLAENAINHTPQGTAVEIVISESGSVSVLDEGPGIPDGERELVFRRFWRRDRRRTGSAGLGLSIVRRIVEAHLGTITVENRPTGGAQFCLSFAAAAP